MLCQRDYFSAVCVEGKVFALGGNRDDRQYLDAVEYYSPEENTWRYSVTVTTKWSDTSYLVLHFTVT